jgi:hypothetical protein
MAQLRQGQAGPAAGAGDTAQAAGSRWPAVRWHRIRHPELAGLILRGWERQGLLVAYGYSRRQGFLLLGLRPRWRWVLALVLRRWPAAEGLRLRRQPPARRRWRR